MTTISNSPRFSNTGLIGGGEPAAIPAQSPQVSGSATLGIANLDQNAAALSTLSSQGMDPAVQRIIDTAMAMGETLDPGGQGQAVAAKLPADAQAQLGSLAGAMADVGKQAGSPQVVNDKWSSFVNTNSEYLSRGDAMALVQHVLRLAYMENTNDLAHQAERTQHLNQQRKEIREYTSEIRNYESGLKTFLAEHGFATAPTNPDELAKYMKLCADYYNNNAHPVPGYAEAQAAAAADAAKAMEALNGLIDKAALTQSAEDVAARAAKLFEEKFGCPLPAELQQAMESMLIEAIGPPENPEKLNKALSFFAAYVSYASDTATANGKFGQGTAGIDDVRHYKGATEPNLEDFAYYLGPDADKYIDFDALPDATAAACQAAVQAAIDGNDPNKIARGNLATGDRVLIEQAFGMQAGTLSGSSVHAVVEQAMTSEAVTWKNRILFGQEVTTEQIKNSIEELGIASPYVETIFGNLGVDAKAHLQTIQNWLQNSSLISAQAGQDMGLPVIPENATPDQIQTVLQELEEKLATLGDDAQLANLELQDRLQKQQQTLQTLSNVSKSLFDTAKSIIQKMS